MIGIVENQALATAHYTTVKSTLSRRIDAILGHNYLHTGGVRVPLDQPARDLLTELQNNSFLSWVVTCSPKNMSWLISILLQHYPDSVLSNSPTFKVLKNIFVEHGYGSFNKLDFINAIGIHTCAYCNRNYIYALDQADMIKPQIDHFYPTSIYPVLGCSYYNLIPSCETCNGLNGKINQDSYTLALKSPYLVDDEDFEFDYKINAISRVHPISGKSSVEVIFKKHLQPHFDVFKLDKLYEKHSDHALELIVKSRIKYSSKYRAYLKSFNHFVFSEAEIDRLILGNYSRTKDLHKRPLSKLYADLGRKLGMI